MPDLSLRLGQDVLVVEGGMGTMLERQGVAGNTCAELLNAIEPETITSIHKLFQMAGAHCAISNTFGGNRTRLSSFGLEGHLQDLNKRGVLIAKDAKPQHVLADMGPCSIDLDSQSGSAFDEAFSQYLEQASALASGDPDAILIETMTGIDDALCALKAAKEACSLPVIVSCVYDADGLMLKSRTSIEEAAKALEDAGADIIGMNHHLDSDQMLPCVERLCKATTLPKLAMPDTGIVEKRPRGFIAPGTPDAFSQNAMRYVQLGVQFVGACCGNTPAYAGAMFALMNGMEVMK